MRDFRTEQTHPIDVALLDELYRLYGQFESRGNFEVISGYRSPQTNEALRHATSGVAEHSLHLRGRAIDVRLTSAKTDQLRDAAIAMQSGGVGYYANPISSISTPAPSAPGSAAPTGGGGGGGG